MEITRSPFSPDISEDTLFPMRIRFPQHTGIDELIHFYHSNREFIAGKLQRNGAILFSGVDINSREDFQTVMSSMGERFLDYADGNSPRTKLSDFVYTSTEYDAGKSITMHNELSYSARWPSRICFCCITPAATGGETPIADGREVLKQMNASLVSTIRDKGLLYIRNLHGGAGFGPSWQDTFEMNDREEVMAYCRERNMRYEWKEDGGIKLMQFSKGIIPHPVTGEMVWFNQIDQFHPSHMGRDVYDVLMQMYEREEELPTYITFGDGSPVSAATVAHILDVMDRVSIVRPWDKGDLILLDNVLVSHGRKPFTGKREVLVSMMQ